MAQFFALKDTNTKVVYEWRRVSTDGSEQRVTIYRENWKPEKEWSPEEIEALFESKPAPEENSLFTRPPFEDEE